MLKDRTPHGSGDTEVDFNNDISMPIRTSRVRFGERLLFRQGANVLMVSVELHQITLTVGNIDQVRDAGAAVTERLKRTHPRKDWRVSVPLDRLKQAEDARARYDMLLMLIAAISLVVGGIGIMNIMLATVTGRTREIGIRGALGAQRGDITLQLNIEAVVQTSIGGLLGLGTGLGMVFGIPLLWGVVAQKPLPAQKTSCRSSSHWAWPSVSE